ncbi:MAG: alpha-xylosidase [Clostridia bacterium]|nr:alpha-xylosidase [Clostridia bacterium]
MLDKHLIAEIRPIANPENIVLWGDYRITVLADRLFRVERDEGHIFCDEATEAVWFRDMPPVTFEKTEKDVELCIKTAEATLVICKEFEKSHVILDGKKILLDNSENMRGTYCTLDCCDGCDLIDGTGKNPPKPIELDMGVVAKNGVAVLDYTRSSVLKSDGMVTKVRRDELDLYVFAYGHDYRAAVRAFYMICGNTPKLPRYALGNWWSRYYAYTERGYLNVLDRMEERDIPITVATVDMDWHWNTQNIQNKPGIEDKMPLEMRGGENGDYYGGFSGWTGYSWNTDLFPDYKAFLRKLHERGCAVTLNLHPATGVRWFEDMYEEMAREMGIDPATERKVDLDFTDDRWINAYFKILHKPYEHDGVDFWWIDWQQGPRAKAAGIDIMWVLNHYHTLDNGKEKTPLILSRYSGVGAHRYPLGFSGDTHSTWKTLAYLPYFTSTASNIGFSWWSHDIGGHQGGSKDNELYLRFVQFGVFSPVNRLHCTSAEYCTKEPLAHTGGTGAIAEEFLRLRHAMLPYLYSAMLDTNEKGRALIEPMYYEYPEAEAAYEAKAQYMFGTELIVAPVVAPADEKGMARTRVWLPKGTWTDIFTGDVYSGGRWVDTVRFMESIPVFAKAGGIVPLDARKHTNSIAEPDKLKVMVFNGNGEYTLREESGETCFASKAEAGKQTLCFKASEGTCERCVKLEFRNIKDGEVRVFADGVPVEAELHIDEFVSAAFDTVPGVEYTAEVEFKADTREYRNERYLWALTRLELSNREKEKLWRLRELDDKELMRTVMTWEGLTENEKIRLTEAW